MSNLPISIIIPSYNEADGISSILHCLSSRFTDSEIIVIDDGSTDRTPEILRQFDIKVISHSINKGYGASLKSGIKAATNENLIFMDSDGQHRAEDIPRLISAIDANDMIVGARTPASHRPIGRRPGKIILTWLAQILSGRKIPDLNSGFRAVKKSVLVKYLHLLPQGFSASTTMTLIFMTRGYSVKFIPISTEKRIGKSTVKPIRDGFGTILTILRLITLINPLKIFFPSSLFLILIGIIWSIPYLVNGKGLTVASLFLMLSGVLIFFMGMIADQISQMRLEKYE
ncbi:MAG: glycosyltransferase family 2 protein [Candidatus Neomarinimicrobiota bacterium]|nr:MAG: glycosyltransferase family 2 protein [Candidatus Neomarinimicrobiota bacterium]